MPICPPLYRAVALTCAVTITGLLGSLGAIAAVQKSGRSGTYYDDALSRYEKKDVAGAVIQLKNALREDPGNLAALVLLGRAQLETGDPAGAEESFGKALQLGVDRSEIAVQMAQALFDQGKFDALLERFPVESIAPAKRIELYVLRAHAQKGLGDIKAALRTLEEARRVAPNSTSVLLSYAEFLAETGRRAEAAKIADEAVTTAPDIARLWTLKGSIALSGGNVAGALAAFDRALAANPGQADARIARVAILVDLGREAEADSDLAVLKLDNPNDPRANYLRAVLLSKRGNAIGVRDNLISVVNVIDAIPRRIVVRRTPQLLLLCGLAYHGLAAYEKSRVCLQDFLKIAPNHVGARRLLGSVLLAQGDARAAVGALEPTLALAPDDADTLALLASAYIAQRRYQTANDYLDKALKASGGAPGVHATLGLSLLGAGRTELGLPHLEQALKKDPGQLRVGVPLAVLYLKQGRAKDAVQVAEAIVKRDPANAAALNLLGVVRSAAGDDAGARKVYDQAVQADGGFAAPQLNLAKLDLREGKIDSARVRLQRLFKDRPNNTEVMLELATVEDRASRPEETIRWLERARAIDRHSTTALERLVEVYLRQRTPEKALDAARQADAKTPDNLEVLAALGRSYLALGNTKEAQVVFGRMTRTAAFDPGWQTEIARFQLTAGNLQGAIYSLDKALSAKPDYLPAQVLMTEVELRSGDTGKAEQRAKAITVASPSLSVGYRLQADVALARKRFSEAITGYRAALGKEGTSEIAMRLYRALVLSGDAGAAIRFVETWLKDRPRDTAALRALAEAQALSGNLTAARSAYEQIAQIEGDDPAVLNNLANVMARQGDKSALSVAEKAYRLAPRDAAVQDTLGWLLVQSGQSDAGLRHLREARLRAPDNAEIHYHLAAALARAGKKDEARRELELALRDGRTFDGQAEAKKLLHELADR